MEIHIHVHEHPDPRTLQALETLARHVGNLQRQGVQLMTTASEIKALLERVDAATTNLGAISTSVAAALTEVANDIRALIARIGNGSGISETDALELKALAEAAAVRLESATTTLQAQAATLTQLGVDTNIPEVPPPPPPPPPPAEEEPPPPPPDTEPS